MKRILITRPRAQAGDFAEKLQVAGFEPIFFPVIEIRPIENNVELEQALANLNNYDWVVFTSANAVEVVFNNPGLPKGDKGLGVRVAAIGPKTAEALQARGVPPDFVPDEYVAESIVPGLGDLQDRWVLLPRAEIARKALPEAIKEAGGIPHEIAVYQTLPAQPEPDGLAALRSGVDVVTLTSPSTVQSFAAIARQNGLDPFCLPGNPLYACIGPITEQAARAEGLINLTVAREYTTEGLIEVIRSLEAS
ncbi:MAG TPA: uroporphyrinogen-III synthase [Anaerolineales bacterium]|nr:uroporphyrinogen-III synthase [Anaerolineales bacterium]